jgi:hypothetical protein
MLPCFAAGLHFLEALVQRSKRWEKIFTARFAKRQGRSNRYALFLDFPRSMSRPKRQRRCPIV